MHHDQRLQKKKNKKKGIIKKKALKKKIKCQHGAPKDGTKDVSLRQCLLEI